jgi:hypothetical protein
VPEFQELSVKRLSKAWETNLVIQEYMAKFKDWVLPKRNFLFKAVWTLYEKEMVRVIDQAYKHRKLHYQDEEEMVEVTTNMMQLLDDVILHQSRLCFHLLDL